MSSIIVLDSSSDEEPDNPKPIPPKTLLATFALAPKISISSLPENENVTLNCSLLSKEPPANSCITKENQQSKNKIETPLKRSIVYDTDTIEANGILKKRLKPKQLSSTVNKSLYENCESSSDFGSEQKSIMDEKIFNEQSPQSSNTSSVNLNAPSTLEEDNIIEETRPIDSVYETLIDACRVADPSEDMEKLIKTKLIKYYYSVHPDFVKSKKFLKIVVQVTDEIKATPELVYYKVKTIVEELKIRIKTKTIVMSNEEVTSTGSKKRDDQIRKLNKGLFILTKRIEKCEELDVDLNDDANSSYLQVERYKKRACQIYEKICDLTGESKHAHRLVKKPISFNGTGYPQFNKTMQSYLNRTKEFPDYFDVLKVLEHCNRRHEFGLRMDQVKTIALDAFNKIGKLLQDRRKTDLYETVAHFTSNSSDPALNDKTLSEKLNDNQKHHTKISSIIEKYAKKQDLEAEKEVELKELNSKDSNYAFNNSSNEKDCNNCTAQEKLLTLPTDVDYDITGSNNNNYNDDDININININGQKGEISTDDSSDKVNAKNVKFIQIYSVTSLSKTQPSIDRDLTVHLKEVDEIVISDDEL